jgi:hypothetical protein
MTKAEGIRRLQVGERLMRRGIVMGITIMGLCLLASAAVSSYNLQEIFVGIGVVLMLMCIVVGGIANSRVKCAKCGRQLQAVPAQIAVATGRCGFCGEKAFDDEAEETRGLAAAQTSGYPKGNL